MSSSRSRVPWRAPRNAGPDPPSSRTIAAARIGALLALAPAVVVELAVLELLLSGVPLWVRLAIAALSLYGFAWLTAWTLGQRVYPHRLGNDALQAHLGAFYRATVPLNAITSVDITPARPAKRTELLLSEDTAAFAVGGRSTSGCGSRPQSPSTGRSRRGVPARARGRRANGARASDPRTPQQGA